VENLPVGRQPPKVYLDVRAAGTMTGWRRGKEIGNQLNIPGVREHGLMDIVTSP